MNSDLTTDRLVLRRFTDSDRDHLASLHNDPEVMCYLTGGNPMSREQIERAYHEVFAREGYCVAIERGIGAFLGWFAFHRTADRDPAQREPGYRLRRSALGKGYATEGALARNERGFSDVEVQRVRAQTIVVNLPSRQVMEQADLTMDYVFHLNRDDPLPSTEEGEVEYGMDRASWQRCHPGPRKPSMIHLISYSRPRSRRNSELGTINTRPVSLLAECHATRS